PDGQSIVYVADNQLYLRRLGDVEARPIAGTNQDVNTPFFSPDGQWIGFNVVPEAKLKKIAVTGGASVTIAEVDNPYGASWGPDNQILVGQGTEGIVRVSANGGTPELVIPAREGEQAEGLQLLPDGDSVLFSVTTASGNARWDAAHIVVQSLSTGNRTVVLQGGNSARYVPTGHLIYALGDGLFAVAFDVGRRAVTGGPVSVVDGIGRSGNAALRSTLQYAASDAGTLVYAPPDPAFGFGAAAGPLTTLVWVDRDGREEPVAAPPRAYAYARLSPDGTRVALDVRDQERDIWIWDLRRQTMTRFTFDPESDILPMWTPDGRRLVWASQRAGRYNLYWQTADGTGAVERLTESPRPQRPNGFTPDGRGLVFAQDQEGQVRDLFLLPIGGDRRATRLVQTMFDERNGEISPDGRWLAYESNESGQSQIYVRPFPAVDEGRWQVSTSGGVQPLWARSGRELFYLAPD
ncbi:MAG: TolB family protein, partial [Burkholderiales bacterium]